ncbi:HEAT repeat domain-containing protein [Thermogutta sp.]|uniref:HEAT repeat domain-containing protein n=1 Tax=Thermogutta sp. TaxID=1962930 RepID=UPI003C7D6B5B
MRARTMLHFGWGLLLLFTGSLLEAQDLATTRDVSQLVAALKDPAATDHEKAVACQLLAVSGGADVVPILKEMLLDPKFSHYARYALEPIPSPEVDQALRDALVNADGGVRLGILNSIGNRRDSGAISIIAPLLENSDLAVVDAAASALGRIGTPEAAEVLFKALKDSRPAARSAVADALLTCAECLRAAGQRDLALAVWEMVRAADVPVPIRVAALQALIIARGASGIDLWKEQVFSDNEKLFQLAMQVARKLPADAALPILSDAVTKLPETRAAVALEVAAGIGSKEALPTVRQFAQQGPRAVRQAALRSLEKIGDASDVALLLAASVDSDEQIAAVARETLEILPGNEVNLALVQAASGASKEKLLVILSVLGQRRASEGLKTIRDAMQSKDNEVRAAAVVALGKVARDDDVVTLVKELTASSSESDRTALMEALRTACQRVGDREKVASLIAIQLQSAPAPLRASLLELLGVLGGKTALAAVAEAAKSPDADLQDAATAVLGNWLSADVAPVIWSLIESNAAPRYRVRLIRAYIRVARQLRVPDQERLEMCRKALSVSERPEERRLILDVLMRNPSPESLSLAAELVAPSDTREAACDAVVTIAEKLNRNVPGLKEALQTVLQHCTNAQVRARAEALVKRFP